MLRLLADRDHQITAHRTRTVCRLHALSCVLIEGGTGRSLKADKAGELLASIGVADPVIAQRVATARQLLAEIRVLDDARDDVHAATAAAVISSGTTVTEVFGI